MSGKYAWFGKCVDRCESPIERLFLVGLLFLRDHTFEPWDQSPIIAVDSTGINLCQQITVGEYRIDFALTHRGASKRLAVEIDGFEHHAKTPAQFEKDAVRQRYLTARGWTFFRYTGREVTRDPRKWAEAAMYEAAKLVDEAGGRPLPPEPPDPALARPRLVVRGTLAGDEPEWWDEFQKRVEAACEAGDVGAQQALLAEQAEKVRKHQAARQGA